MANTNPSFDAFSTMTSEVKRLCRELPAADGVLRLNREPGRSSGS